MGHGSFGCKGDDGLKTFNAAPEADITSHDNGATELEGYTVTFRGSVSDPDDTAANLLAL